jgi:halocarboxylic acid dehydrogenase DehI
METVRRRDVKLPEVKESEASGEVREAFDRINETLRLSTTNHIWRVFATKPRFLRAVWDQLEPVVDRGFMEAAEGMRAMAIERVREAASISDHRPFLGEDLSEAEQELRVFLEGNPRSMILLCALRRSWQGADIGGARPPEPAERGVPPWHPQVQTVGLTERADLHGVFKDMVEVLDLPAPSTDYLALGKWPRYLERAWMELKPFVGSDSWRELCFTLDWLSEQTAVALPAKIDLSADGASDLGLSGEEVDQVGTWIETFHGLLPGLIANTSYLWIGLHGGSEHVPLQEAAVNAPGTMEAPERRASAG